jgi:hypothetical protein
MAMVVNMTKTEHLQDIVNRYIKATKAQRVDMREVASWAIRSGLWEASRRDAIKQCAHELARAARDEFFTDPQGRDVRKKHALRLSIIENGEEKQLSFWVDITTASPTDMHLSLQQRRGYIVGDCKQLKTDLDSFNTNFNRGVPIQLSFNFSEDVEEAVLPTEYPDAPPGE